VSTISTSVLGGLLGTIFAQIQLDATVRQSSRWGRWGGSDRSERGEGLIPPEAKEYDAKKDVGTKGPATEVGRKAIRGEPEAIGASATRVGPDGNLVSPERTELYHSVETTKEIGAGIGPNPSWTDDPGDSATFDLQKQGTDAQDEPVNRFSE
jgi:hypothetical protein